MMSDKIWKFFHKEIIEIHEERKVKCILCDELVRYNSDRVSTKCEVIMDMNIHLVKQHPDCIKLLDARDRRSIGKNLKRKRKSYLFKYFTDTPTDFIAKCNYCNNDFSYKTNIYNLRKHLKSCHPEVHVVPDNDTKVTDKNKTVTEDEVSGSDTEYNDIDDEPIERTSPTLGHELENVWNCFESIPGNRSRCILCKETLNSYKPFLIKHVTEKHRKTLNLSSDSEDEQNSYTEVVYLKGETSGRRTSTSTSKPRQINIQKETTRKRKLSTTNDELFITNQKKEEPKKDDKEDEIEIFGRYILNLLKQLPKDNSMQLQRDIINVIINTKLKTVPTTPVTEGVNFILSGIRDGVVTPDGVIVTTASEIIHTSHCDSLPSIVILDKKSECNKS